MAEIDCLELQWWFAVPRLGDQTMSAFYEIDTLALNLRLWELAATPRPTHNPAWEAVCREQLRDFIADVRQRAHE